MKIGYRILLSFLIAITFAGPVSSRVPLDMGGVTGAAIDESAVGLTIHVDLQSAFADDNHPGTAPELPKRTLEGALDAAFAHMDAADEGVRIRLAEGIYESPALDFRPGNPRTEQNLLVIEGEERGKVLVRGGMEVERSEIQLLGDGLYKIEWLEDNGPSTRPWFAGWTGIGGEIAHRREMLYIDGQPLEPVILEPHDSELIITTASTTVEWTYSGVYSGPSGITRPGTFGISEIEDNALYFRPPEGVDMTTAIVRIGRPESILSFRGKSNLVLRNLVFCELGNYHQDPAIRVWGTSSVRISNVLIEDVEVYDIGSGTGLTVSVCDNITLRKLIVRGVGGNGIDGSQNSNYVMEDLDVSLNNWRSQLGGMRRWTVGGCKILRTEGFRVSRYVAYANGASGFWMDTDVNNVLIEDMVSTENSVFGIYNEKNDGDTLIRDSVFSANGDFGVHSAESWYMTLRDSIVFKNKLSAIGVRSGAKYNTFLNNTMVGTLLGGTALYTYTGDTSRYLAWFVGGHTGDYNRYWVPFVTNAFRVDNYTDFAGWQAATGQEASSSWEDPGFSESASGLCRIYLYEDCEATSLNGLREDTEFNFGNWSQSIESPVFEMPRNWRRGAIVEIHARVVPPESGIYEFALSAGQEAALHIGWEGSLASVESVPLLETTTPVPFRDFLDESSQTVSVALTGKEPLYVVLRTVVPVGTVDPHLTVAWKLPLEPDFTVLTAPFLDTGDPVTRSEKGISGAYRTPDGLKHLDGWGWLDDTRFPWVYHYKQGWSYIMEADQGGFWCYDPALGWLYVDPALDPFIWDSSDNSWLVFWGFDTQGLRWVYDSDPGEWSSL